jgi:hypothetical protein
MSTKIEFTLIAGGIYELRGKGGKVVRFKFLHANSGKLTIDIGGTQFEVPSILGLLAPEDFQGFYVVDAPAYF